MENNAFEIGYQTASEMLDGGAYPTSRELTTFDIVLYGEVAASVLSISLEQQQHPDRRIWIDDFVNGYLERLNQYIVLGRVQIQRWKRNGPFGVAGAPAKFYEVFRDMGGHEEPAHYGFTYLSEHFRQDSWVFPTEAWEKVVRMLKQAYQEE